MARHRSAAWTLNDPVKTWDEVQVAVLMDIRDELQALNRVMQCSNVREGFISLQRIDRRMERNGMLLHPRKRKSK